MISRLPLIRSNLFNDSSPCFSNNSRRNSPRRRRIRRNLLVAEPPRRLLLIRLTPCRITPRRRILRVLRVPPIRGRLLLWLLLRRGEKYGLVA